MHGASFLLQDDRGHPYRHFPHGDAREPQPSQLNITSPLTLRLYQQNPASSLRRRWQLSAMAMFVGGSKISLRCPPYLVFCEQSSLGVLNGKEDFIGGEVCMKGILLKKWCYNSAKWAIYKSETCCLQNFRLSQCFIIERKVHLNEIRIISCTLYLEQMHKEQLNEWKTDHECYTSEKNVDCKTVK